MTERIDQNSETAMILIAMESWQKAFSASTCGNIIALYSHDASLWGTLSPVRRATPTAIKDYFTCAFIFTNRSVTFHDRNIRCYGNMAVSSGTYTFTLTKDGEKMVIPSRYSFVYTKQNHNWLIVEHHSSPLPLD